MLCKHTNNSATWVPAPYQNAWKYFDSDQQTADTLAYLNCGYIAFFDFYRICLDIKTFAFQLGINWSPTRSSDPHINGIIRELIWSIFV